MFTHEEYSAVLGDQVMATYARNKRIEQLESEMAAQAQRISTLETQVREQEAIIHKFSIEPAPSLPKDAPDVSL